MANNLVVGNNGVIAKASAAGVTFTTAGFNETNCAIIYKLGNPIVSWKPGRDINSITAFESTTSYLIKMLAVADKTTYLIPPIADEVTDPEVYLDNFAGTASANITSRASDKGTFTSPLAAILLDGAGNATTHATNPSQILPGSAAQTPANKKLTLVVNSLSDAKQLLLTVRRNGGGTDYNFISFTRDASTTNYALQIQNAAGALQTANIANPTFPVTIVAQISGSTITGSVNGADTITNAATVTGNYADFVSTGTSVWTSAKVETI